MNILKHYHRQALSADRNGYPWFAAAIRSLLAQEIEQASTADFWGFVLDLPAIECDRVGFLDTLTVCGCHTKEQAVAWGKREFVQRFGRGSRVVE